MPMSSDPDGRSRNRTGVAHSYCNKFLLVAKVCSCTSRGITGCFLEHECFEVLYLVWT